MKKATYIIIALAVLAGLTILIRQSSPQKKTTNEEKLVVGATIFPLYDITRNIGGDYVSVVNILPPGASPHTFEPMPSTIKSLQRAKAVFAVGHGLDNWVNQIAESIPGLSEYIVDSGITLQKSHEEEDEHGNEEADAFDPHYWLDVHNAKIIDQNIADKLVELDPAHADAYRANLRRYQGNLDALQAELSEHMAPYAGQDIITFHDGWFYFADAFQLTIAGVFEPSPGKEPTPRYLESLQTAAEEKDIKTVFSEPQFSNETLKPFIKDLGLSLSVLDPLGGVVDRDSYIGLMRYNVDTIANALYASR